MDKIEIRDIRLYAYHGCLEEESIIGSDYRVDLTVWGDLDKSTASDDLKDTIDYVTLNTIVKKEMAIRSSLLEHVCLRIIKTIFKEIELVAEASVSVAKLNPPIGGDAAEVVVTLHKKRV